MEKYHSKITVGLLTIVIIIVNLISVLDVYDYWVITHGTVKAYFLSAITFLFIIVGLFSTRYSKFGYLVFMLGIILEIQGNVFSVFLNINPDSIQFKNWVALVQPIFKLEIFGLSLIVFFENLNIFTKNTLQMYHWLLAVLQGSIIPLSAIILSINLNRVINRNKQDDADININNELDTSKENNVEDNQNERVESEGNNVEKNKNKQIELEEDNIKEIPNKEIKNKKNISVESKNNPPQKIQPKRNTNLIERLK